MVDAPVPTPTVKINRWLPYWAVFQMDFRQTLRSWVYRVWVLVSLVTVVGYLLYRIGVQKEAGILQNASLIVSDVLRWTVLGSVTLIVVLTAGSISSERGTLADSVLSRGISRHQYFLGKWHARLVAVLGTYFVMGICALVGSFFLHDDLSLVGSLLALVTVTALLTVVITCGVTVSAFVNSTMMAIALLWFVLYGIGFALSMMPSSFPSPNRILNSLPDLLSGNYNLALLSKVVSYSFLSSLAIAVTGLVYFSRRDV